MSFIEGSCSSKWRIVAWGISSVRRWLGVWFGLRVNSA